MTDHKLGAKLTEILRKELTPKEELDRAWDIFMKLPKEDRFVLMLYLCKTTASLCDTEFFIRFANDYEDIPHLYV